MSGVKVERYGIIHYYAQCQDCEWDCGMNTDIADTPEQVRDRIHTHVSQTGHTIVVESGSATKYSPK